MRAKERSFEDYAYLTRVVNLLHWTGFLAGWLVFMYYWVYLLWDVELVVIPSVTIGLLVYIVAFIIYELKWRAKIKEYTDVTDLLCQPYWDLVLSMMENDREKAQKAIDDLNAYVNPGG